MAYMQQNEKYKTTGEGEKATTAGCAYVISSRAHFKNKPSRARACMFFLLLASFCAREYATFVS